jgi:hypothetical protein
MDIPPKLLKNLRKKYGKNGNQMSDKGIVLSVLSEYVVGNEHEPQIIKQDR